MNPLSNQTYAASFAAKAWLELTAIQEPLTLATTLLRIVGVNTCVNGKMGGATQIVLIFRIIVDLH